MKTNLLSSFAAVLLFSTLAFSTMTAQNPMCMVGNATKYGWDKNNSSPMTQDGVNPSKFYYSAYLFAGNFKFLKQNSDWVPSWNKGANETTVVKRPNYGDPADQQFTIATAGNYDVVMDTAALTLSVTLMAEPTLIMFNTVFMLGDAAPNGWDLGTATELVKNPTNPFEFSYTGALKVGALKFPINRWWDWNKDFFMKVSDNLMELRKSPDTQWSIAEAANYKVTLNINTLAISIVKQVPTSNEELLKENVSLESNVVSNELQINISKTSNYVINSITGTNLMKGAIINGKINVSSLNNGIYLLNVDNKSFKFIKQ